MEKKIPYEIDGRRFEGMLVCDDSARGKRPGILMQPDWKGVCLDTVEQARLLAGSEYVVFMADMFGAGYGAKPKTLPELMQSVRTVREDLPFTVKAGERALSVMLAEADALIDPSRVTTVGYCAGGGFALEHARTGPGLKAVVVFHVTNPNPVDAKVECRIKGRVLVVHGSADPVTPMPMIHKLEDELTAANVGWQTIMFSGAAHSFTDPTANLPGRNQYDAPLARRTYALTREFLAETL